VGTTTTTATGSTGRKVGLGLIGLGRWAMVLGASLRQLEATEIVAAYDAHEPTARNAAETFNLPLAGGLDELLADPTVRGVLVVTTNDTHREIAGRALEAGKDVFVEKPVTTTIRDAEELIRLAAEKDRVLMVGHNTRRSPAVRMMKRLLDEGRIGAVHSFDATFSRRSLEEITTPTWRNDPVKCPGGPLLQLAVHHADNLLYLAGPAERVWVDLLSPPPGGRVPAGGRLQVALASGALATISSDYCTAPEVFSIRARGEEGELSVLDEHGLVFTDERGRAEDLQPKGPSSIQAELEEFIECIVSRRTPETGGPEGLEALRLILTGLEAARRGYPLPLEGRAVRPR